MSSDEGSNGDELDLKHISGDWSCVVVRIVRWWCCYCLKHIDFFPFFFCWLYACYFSLLRISFLCLPQKDVPYPLRPSSSTTRCLKLFLLSFPSGIHSPIFSAPQHFNPILLKHIVFPLDSGVFCLPYMTTTFLGRWFVPDLLQVFLSQYCKFSKLFVELGWMVDFLIEVFLHLYFE